MTNSFTDYAILVEDDEELLETIVHLQSVIRGHATRTKLKKASAEVKDNVTSSEIPLRSDTKGKFIEKPLSDEVISLNDTYRVQTVALERDEQGNTKKRSTNGQQKLATDETKKMKMCVPLSALAASSKQIREVEQVNENRVLKRGRGRPWGSLNKKTIRKREEAMALMNSKDFTVSDC